MTIPDLSTAEAGSRLLDEAVAREWLGAGVVRPSASTTGQWVINISGEALSELPHYSTSIDAAVALVERVLPGTKLTITVELGYGSAAFRLHDGPGGVSVAEAPTAPLAILRALQAAVEGK